MVKKYFFITGLPRSRTSWLANFFTYRKSFCYHELIKVTTMDEMAKSLNARPENIVGTADSVFPFYAHDLLTKGIHWKDGLQPPIVIINRKRSEVFESLLNAFGRENTMEFGQLLDRTEESLVELRKNYKCMEVDFDDLNHKEVLLDISLHIGIEWFDYPRYKMLDELIIEPLVSKYLDNINALEAAKIVNLIFGDKNDTTNERG